MKIVEIISDTNIGGAGVLLCNRLACTDMKKYKTVVLLPRGSMLCERLKQLHVPYMELDCKGDCSFDISAISQYIKIFKCLTPDIINAHGCLSARIAAYMCRISIKICTRHCVFPTTKSERLFGKVNNMLSDCFIAVADSARDNLLELGINKNKIKVIINGARELTRIAEEEKARIKNKYNINDGTVVLGLCARLEKCKGHDWFFKCVSVLAKTKLDFFVLLIGDGSQRKYLESLCEKYEIDNKVAFCGFVKDTSSLMNIVDININCSVGTETSSLALSEGMSLGLPAVVSDFGGNPYMIKHGQNGFVCKTGDYIQMAKYIRILAEDKALYRRMSINARKRFERELNCKSMTEKTNRLYDALYAKSRKC